MYKKNLKRFIDFSLSLTTLIFLSPVLMVITIWLHFANKGAGAFFFQVRPGKNAKPIKIIKYKSMTDDRDEKGNLLPDIKRLTKVGRFVRATSIDELPQFFNILKGEMSFIGPRPLLTKYLPYYTQREQLRHSVKPGITGLAQVNGRNNLSWDKRLEYDVQYVENISFKLDLKIVFMTISRVFLSKDVNIVPGETMKNLDVERNI